MKKILSTLLLGISIFMTSCSDEEKVPEVAPNYNPQATNIPLYYGKFVYTDSAKLILDQLANEKGGTIFVEIGCECGDEVGENKNTQQKKIVPMYIGGDQLESVKALNKDWLKHLYFKYMYAFQGSNDPNAFTTKSGAVIQSTKVDLLDKIPLEKVTIYTSNSIKLPTISDTNRTPIKVSIKKDTLTHKSDSGLIKK